MVGADFSSVLELNQSFSFLLRELRSNLISLIEPGAFLGLAALKRL